MAEIRVRMILNVCFDLLPVTFIVSDFLAMGADRQNPAQDFDFLECRFQFLS